MRWIEIIKYEYKIRIDIKIIIVIFDKLNKKIKYGNQL